MLDPRHLRLKKLIHSALFLVAGACLAQDANEALISPYYKGWGGVSGEADGTVTVTTECGSKQNSKSWSSYGWPGAIALHLEGIACGAGVVRVSGLKAGAWYWTRTSPPVASPLLPESWLRGSPANVPAGLSEVDPQEHGTYMQLGPNAAIVPYIGGAVLTGGAGGAAFPLVSPYYGGWGGVSGQAGGSVKITTDCGTKTWAQEDWPGAVALHLEGLACQWGGVEVEGLKAGAWYWTGTHPPVASPLLPRYWLRGPQANVAEGAFDAVERQQYGTYVELHGTAAIVPHVAAGLPSGGTLQTSVSSYTSSSASFAVDLFATDAAGNPLSIGAADVAFEDSATVAASTGRSAGSPGGRVSSASATLEFTETGFDTLGQSYVGPYSATLVLDQSRSIRWTDPDDYRISGAAAFLETLDPAAQDEVALIAFRGFPGFLNFDEVLPYWVTIYVPGFSLIRTRLSDLGARNPFTRDPRGFDSALEELRRVENGGTPLFDAVRDAVNLTADNSTNSNRVVIVLADGDNNQGGASLDEVVELANTRGVPVHTIGLKEDVNWETLSRLARETGGSMAESLDARQVVTHFDSLGPYLSGSGQYFRLHGTVDVQDGTFALQPGASIVGTVVVTVPPGPDGDATSVIVRIPFRLGFE